MRAGRMYHRVAFYAKVSAKDTFGASVDTYETIPSINTRGEIRWTGGQEQLSGEEKFYSKNMELTIRYRSDIDETYRLKIDGKPSFYQIAYIEELGMHEGLRLTVSKLNE